MKRRSIGQQIPAKITKNVALEGSSLKSSRSLKKAGPYLLGPRLANSPVKSIVQCLARKDGSDDFYSIKILTLQDFADETQDDRQGKMLLHTEYSLLSLLHDQKGVVHHHGLFKDQALEEREVPNGTMVYTGKHKERLCLVLDCLSAHDFSSKTSDLVNLQHYVIKEKKLAEKDALVIFYEVVVIVSDLHKRNIVHRDLKLGNMVLNKKTRKITITNFCLGKHLLNENDLLKDQRGSPAYISPDVLSGKHYLGKPSDMWAIGVLLFTMLYGQFPFYDSVPQELFRKIKAAEYTIPTDSRISESTIAILKKLLVLNTKLRLTANQVIDALQTTFALWTTRAPNPGQLQVVPDLMEDNSTTEVEKNVPQGFLLDQFSMPNSIVKVRNTVRNMSEAPTLSRPFTGQPLTGSFAPSIPSSWFAVNIPIRRIHEDARPLSAAELMSYRQLLNNQP